METVADQVLYSVELADTVHKSCGSVHDSLEPIKLVLWCTGQQTVTVVDPWDDKAIDYCFCSFRWQSSDRTLYAAELVEAAADKLVDVRTERQLCSDYHSHMCMYITSVFMMLTVCLLGQVLRLAWMTTLPTSHLLSSLRRILLYEGQ